MSKRSGSMSDDTARCRTDAEHAHQVALYEAFMRAARTHGEMWAASPLGWRT